LLGLSSDPQEDQNGTIQLPHHIKDRWPQCPPQLTDWLGASLPMHPFVALAA